MIKRFKWEDGLLASVNKNWVEFAILLVTFFAVILRFVGFPFASGDYNSFLVHWVDFLRNNGHLQGLAMLQTDYSAPYLYFLALISYLPKSLTLGAIKFVSCLFDFACAFMALKIVKHLTTNEKYGIMAYAAILFCPTIFVDSSVWAQCDAIFTFFLLAMLFAFLKEKPQWALLCFGIAFSFKLQAVFLLPFVIILYLYHKWSVKQLPFAVAGFFIMNVPAWFLGQPFSQCISIYFLQSKTYQWSLALNAPSAFALLRSDERYNSVLAKVGICFTMAVLVCLALFVLKMNRQLSTNTILLLFLFCALVIPYFLPHMHERYFYIADVAVILYALVVPNRWWIIIPVIFPSCVSYAIFLFDSHAIPLPYLAIIMFVGVIFTIKWLIESIVNELPNDKIGTAVG